MKINPYGIYTQKMYEINERISERLSSIQSSQSFYLALQKAQSKTQGTYEAQSSKGTAEYSQSVNVIADSNGVIDLDSTDSQVNGFSDKYDSIIAQKSSLYGVNSNLIKAMIKAESDFNPNCVSSAGAMGLMQLMPVNVRELNVQDPFNPEQNIDGGIREIKGYLNSYNGDVKLALAAYNCGPTRVRKLGLDNLNDPEQFAKLPAETRNYINKIMKYLQ